MSPLIKKVIPVAVLAAVGMGVSVTIEIVHQRLAANVNYTSFCNVNATVNCDVVLSSAYAHLLGMPISRWALLYYVTVLALTVGVALVASAKTRQTLGTAIFALAAWGLLFSGYMAVVAFGVLKTVCLMCSALYLTGIGLFVGAWRLRSGVQIAGRRQVAQRAGQERLVLIGAAAAVLLLVAVVGWEAVGRGSRVLSAADIEQQRPDFYRWFFAQPTTQVPLDASHARGDANAPVTIVEFSDFECGHCAAFHQSLDEVLRRGRQDVRVVFRHFPLDSACNPSVPSRLHPQACLAAVAAECAGEQGKFWQYHNLLFDNQSRLEREFLIGYARRLDLDTARFTTCLGSTAARERVAHDAQAGAALGIDSTPTFFINGRIIKGALDPDRLGDALVLARAPH